MFFKKPPLTVLKNTLLTEKNRATFQNDWKEIQSINSQLLWIDIYVQGNQKFDDKFQLKNVSIEDLKFPDEFKDEDVFHFPYAHEVVSIYGKTLGESDLYFRSASELQHPKELIRRCIEYINHHLSTSKPNYNIPDKNTYLDSINAIGEMLYRFLDVPSSVIPKGKKENLIFGHTHIEASEQTDDELFKENKQPAPLQNEANNFQKKYGVRQPNFIYDFAIYATEYIELTRKHSSNPWEIIDEYAKHSTSYFVQNHNNKVQLQKDIITYIDQLYNVVVNLPQLDKFTEAYFNVLIGTIFKSFKQLNVLVFYILDNELRDDRFKLLYDLLTSSNIAVMYPYEIKPQIYSETVSLVPAKPLPNVLSALQEEIKHSNHIFYLEKDSSVNYLNDILEFAENNQEKYICLFRNDLPSATSKPVILSGDFKKYLK